jgi:hypothetical protein
MVTALLRGLRRRVTDRVRRYAPCERDVRAVTARGPWRPDPAVLARLAAAAADPCARGPSTR